MRNLLALTLMIYNINCFAQGINPDLYQTWYLYEIVNTDDQSHYPVSSITPSISPSLTFTETLDFYGEGSCNSFNGTFSSPFDGGLQFNNFSSTLFLCDSSEQTAYEGAFFSLMQFNIEKQYFISGMEDNMRLVIQTPIFSNYIFGNAQLSTPNFEIEETLIYPNPTDSKIFVNSHINSIDKIEVFNSLGQNVKTINGEFEVIDVSDFDSGIYLVKLYSKDKSVSKKIIKK